MKKRSIAPPKHPSGTFALRTLLYVEDNDDNWVVAELRLGSKFHLIRAATDRQACEMLVQYAPRLCAVLMDIELQGSDLNGIELARLMRGTLQRPKPSYAKDVPTLNVPLIFVTAYNQVYADDVLRAAGGDLIMAKPVDFRVLNMALMNLQVGRLHAGRKQP